MAPARRLTSSRIVEGNHVTCSRPHLSASLRGVKVRFALHLDIPPLRPPVAAGHPQILHFAAFSCFQLGGPRQDWLYEAHQAGNIVAGGIVETTLEAMTRRAGNHGVKYDGRDMSLLR